MVLMPGLARSIEPQTPNRLSTDVMTYPSTGYGFMQSRSFVYLRHNPAPDYSCISWSHLSSDTLSAATIQTHLFSLRVEHDSRLLSGIPGQSSRLSAIFAPNQAASSGTPPLPELAYHPSHSSVHYPSEGATGPGSPLHYHESLANPSPEAIPSEQLEQYLSSLPHQADYGERLNPIPAQGSSSSFQHDSSLANPDLWAEFLAELDADQSIGTNNQPPGFIPHQDVFDDFPLPSGATVPDSVDFNHSGDPDMAILFSPFQTHAHRTSVSLSDHHDSRLILDLQDSENTTSGSSVTGPPSSFGEGERDESALSQSRSLDDLWVQSFTNGVHAPYQPTSNAVSQSYHHHPTSVSPTKSHYHPVDLSSSTAPSRQQLLAEAFRLRTNFPNEARARLLDLIIPAPFTKAHQLEPSIDSSEGQALLRNIRNLPDCPPMAFQKSSLSIFALLVDTDVHRCLICGSAKTSLDRAVGCVRSHLDHRPFVCGGEPTGCVRCKDYAKPRRFFSLSYVADHIKGQLKKFKCSHPECKSSVRRGGMERHWKRMHNDCPFPKENYPRYRRTRKASNS